MSPKTITLFLSVSFFSLSVANAQKKQEQSTHHHKWAAGIGTGMLHISGDVPAVTTQLQQSLYLVKPFASWFALRFSYTHGNAKGMHWLASQNFAKNPVWASKYAAPVRMPNGTIAYGYTSNAVFTPATKADNVFYNYKTAINNMALAAQFTLPIPFKQPRAGIYIVAGAGTLFYTAKVNAGNSNGTYATLFNQITTSPHSSKKDILNTLKKGMDDSYETNAEEYSSQPHFTQHVGFGFSYRFKKRFEAGIDQVYTFIKSDLLDGQRWQEQAYGDAAVSRDNDWLVMSTVNLKYYF